MRRYERASTIITSNRPLGDWPKLFGDTPAVAAFLDRLMYHSHLIEIRGKSYRLHESSLPRPRRAEDALAIASIHVLPSTLTMASAPEREFTRLNGRPAHAPTDASPSSSRTPTHGLGSI